MQNSDRRGKGGFFGIIGEVPIFTSLLRIFPEISGSPIFSLFLPPAEGSNVLLAPTPESSPDLFNYILQKRNDVVMVVCVLSLLFINSCVDLILHKV